MTTQGIAGLTGQLRDKLIQQALQRKLKRVEQTAEQVPGEHLPEVPEAWYRFDRHPRYQQMRIVQDGGAHLGVADPFFRVHEGIAGATTRIDGRELINFASYNYLGLSGHPAVSQAAKDAIDRYGTSVSASRLVSGERPIHRELESALARAYGVDDAVAFVSGHATNVTTIGHLFGPKDLILHDALVHNSVLQGIALSGAKRMPFAHNDWNQLDALLKQHRRDFERVLIAIEGLYSMDGDYPDLPRFVEVKRKHRAFLMVDEAHSFGVMGETGKGIREHFGLDGTDVDIWMGTLSKALAGCGGYIAGDSALVEHLRYLAPGFLYSVGMPPAIAAASFAALAELERQPERVARLQKNGIMFLALAREAGIDTGTSAGIAIVPAITGSSLKAARLTEALFRRGINAQPILHPAVPEKAARVRFFIGSEHTEEQIQGSVQSLGDAVREVRA